MFFCLQYVIVCTKEFCQKKIYSGRLMKNAIQILINTKQRDIILALLDSGSHITLKEISEKTGLSLRTIRYNMNTVQGWFMNEDIQVRSRPGYGYELVATNAERKRIRSELIGRQNQMISFTRAERQQYAIFMLLHSNTPLSYKQLSNNIGISRSTIIKDLKEITKWLDRFHLKLNQTPNRGTYVTGSELNRRYAMVLLIKEIIGIRNFYSLAESEDCLTMFKQHRGNEIGSYLESLPVRECRELIKMVEVFMGLRLALDSQIMLNLYISVTLSFLMSESGKRRSGKKSQYTYELENPVQQTGYEAELAILIIKEITKRTNLRLRPEETLYMTVMILIVRWEINEENYLGLDEYANDRIFHLDEESIRSAGLIIAACSSQLNPLIQYDDGLHMNLARHLQAVLQLLRCGLPVINDHVDMAISRYPEVYRSVKSKISLLEDFTRSKFPVEEIALITMYMVSSLDMIQAANSTAVSVTIIGDGLRTETIFLQNRLKLVFPAVKVSRILNGFPDTDEPAAENELILSLLPGNNGKNNVINVTPFLLPDEIRTIQEWIEDYENKNLQHILTPVYKPNLIDILKPEHIRIAAEPVGDWRQVVRTACEPLELDKSIRRSYTQSIIDITEKYGPYSMIAPGVILLHAQPGDGAEHLSLSMLLMRNEVSFGYPINIDIALVISMPYNYSHLNALYQLNVLFKNEDFLSTIRNCNSEMEIMRTFWIFSLDYQLTNTSIS